MTQNELLVAVTLLAFVLGLVAIKFSRHTNQIADIKSNVDVDRKHLNKAQDDITSLVLQQDIRNEMVKRLEDRFTEFLKLLPDALVPFRVISGQPLSREALDALKEHMADAKSWVNVVKLPDPPVVAPQPVPPGLDPLTAASAAYENAPACRDGNLHQRMKDLLWQWEVLNSDMITMCNSDGVPIAPVSLRRVAKEAFEASLVALVAEVRRTPAVDPPRSRKVG